MSPSPRPTNLVTPTRTISPLSLEISVAKQASEIWRLREIKVDFVVMYYDPIQFNR